MFSFRELNANNHRGSIDESDIFQQIEIFRFSRLDNKEDSSKMIMMMMDLWQRM